MTMPKPTSTPEEIKKKMATIQKTISSFHHKKQESTADKTCIICMEVLPVSQLKTHKNCKSIMSGPWSAESYVICCSCLIRTLHTHLSSEENNSLEKGQTKCPHCKEVANLFTDFVDVERIEPAVEASKKAVYTSKHIQSN